MDIDKDGNIKLLGEIESDDQTVYFYGAKGYNNVIYTLDTKCNALYRNTSLEITAQSVKLEDIIDRFSSAGAEKLSNCVSTKVGELSTGTNIKDKDVTNNLVTYIQGLSYYPDIYGHQEGAGIDIYSESDKYYSTLTSNTGKKADVNLTVKQTYYNTSHSADDFDSKYGDTVKLNNMFFGAEVNYWLASRCVSCKETWTEFDLRYVRRSDLDGYYLLNSRGIQYGSYAFHVRPVVTIPSSIQVIKCSGINSDSNTHRVVTE